MPSGVCLDMFSYLYEIGARGLLNLEKRQNLENLPKSLRTEPPFKMEISSIKL